MRLFTILLILFSSIASAQNCSSIPGMSPTTAIPVCGATTFLQNSVASCTGPSITSPCLPLVTSNSFWYKFHCYQSGTQGLGFIISPQSATDDYDWTIFDVTGQADMNVVYTNMSTQFSVNLCGFTGQTGCSSAGTSSINCEGNTNLWNQLAPVQAGHDYLLMVTNWSNSGLGYGLSFTGGDAVIDNNVAPGISSVSTVGCNTAQLKLTFTKDIRCNSVTATGSELLITPGNFPVTGITSNCSTGSVSITELIINLQSALPAGNYNLVINNGTDANTFLDACDVAVPVATQVPFTIGAQGSPVIDAISFNGCSPSVFNISLSKPILCSSITAAGSEFSITPGNPAISSIQSACSPAQSYITSLQIILQNPLPFGNYQLNINNGTDGNTLIDTCGTAFPVGYNFPLLINQTTSAPVIQSVGFNECQPDKLVLNFDKPVNCNSLTAAGTEFSVTPGSWPITSISSGCSSNLTSQVILTLQNNLPAGNFNININDGTDGNTLSDTCFSFIATGYTKPFVTTQAPLPVFDSVSFSMCNPSSVKVYYSHPIKCADVSADGSEFSITGPSAVNITGASTNTTCSQGYSNWILLQLSQPVNTVGNYTLHNGTGSDGNGIIDTCNATQSNAETISFNVLVKPTAAFTHSVGWGCVLDTIFVAHPGGDAVNSWTWAYSDATAGVGQNDSHLFPINTITAGVQLIVSNGSCADTANIAIPLNNAINADFSQAADTVCISKPLTFTDNSSGSNLQYEWQFGDNTIFSGQTPPPHSYAGNASYTVNLICTNDHGCKDTATKNVYATAMPVVSFSGLHPQYCTREPVVLTADMQGNISSYNWTNGNGQTLQNTPTASFSYSLQNQYTITLSANDRFCGIVPYSETTQVYHVPVVDLGRDTALCPGMRITLGAPEAPGLTYLWNTGATSAQIMTQLTSNTYMLTIDNHGCKGDDQIYVEMLDGCLIRVPGAFTPNGDGTNDRLKAMNAFLATNFSLSIYNRFGQMVYQSSNPVEGWDGRMQGQEQETGTYVWLLRYTDPWTHLPVFQKGTSILIR